MNPFELLQSQGIYKVVMLYFSRRRGLAIVGRTTMSDNVEVVQFSGEVNPRTGNFTALDYSASDRNEDVPIITKRDFERLVSFIADKIDEHTKMSVIEPDVLRSILSNGSSLQPGEYIH